jgi:RNA polymerase sigma-70 factor, ECF subfamily
LKNSEIAEKYDISKRTVEKHITNALKLLRTELKDYITVLLMIFSLH